jgi:hypothetical protein
VANNNIRRRAHPRTASHAVLEISHDAFGTMLLHAKNASAGGFFVLRGAHNLPPKGTEVKVIIRRYTGALNSEPTVMKVAHVSDEGMGLAFV